MTRRKVKKSQRQPKPKSYHNNNINQYHHNKNYADCSLNCGVNSFSNLLQNDHIPKIKLLLDALYSAKDADTIVGKLALVCLYLYILLYVSYMYIHTVNFNEIQNQMHQNTKK